MCDKYKIAGQSVRNPSEWERLLELLGQVGKPVEGYIDDCEIDKDDLVAIMDRDGDGGLTVRDFTGDFHEMGQVTMFREIDRILSKHGFNLSKQINIPEIKFLPFQDYYPKTAERRIEFSDPLSIEYFTRPYGNGILRKVIKGDPIEDLIPKEQIVRIKDLKKFKRAVVETARELGYDKEKIANLSIHDAIMLSGRITARRLEYEDGMISDDQREFHNAERNELWFKLFIHGMDHPSSLDNNDLAKKVDGSTTDEVFEGRRAICRNYAPVNAAVFQVLKDMNPGLKNTYMRAYSPDGLAHILSFLHAWNMVTTVTEKGVDVTFVDPTWLDTRKKTAMADGKEISDSVSEEDIYNAFDEKHFGPERVYAKDYAAQYYELMGSYFRNYIPQPFGTNTLVTTAHWRKAFEMRIEFCERMVAKLQSGKLSDSDSERIKYEIADNFAKAVDALNGGTGVGLLLDVSPYTSWMKEKSDEVNRLISLYDEVEAAVPETIDLKILGLGIIKPGVEPTMRNIAKVLKSANTK